MYLRLTLLYCLISITLFGCVAGELGTSISGSTGGSTGDPSFNGASPTPLPTVLSTPFTTTSYTFQTYVTNASIGEFEVLWYVDGVLFETDTSTSPSYLEDPSSLGTGTYSITAELRNPSGSTLYDSYSWSLEVTSSSAYISASTPTFATQVYAINGVDINTSAATANSPLANGFNTGASTTTRGTATDFCIQVNNIVGTGSGVYAIFYNNSDATVTAPTILSATATDYCINADMLNTTLTYTLSSSTVEEDQTLTVRVFDVGSGSQIEEQSWNINVEPANTPAIITENTSGGEIDPSSTHSTTMDTTFTVKFDVIDQDDDPTDLNDFEVYFLINGLALDETTASSITDPAGAGTGGTDVLNPDCTLALSDAAVFATRFECSLQISSYTASGSRAPGTYTVTGYVQDTTTNGQSGQTSNTISWGVSTSETSTAPDLYPIDTSKTVTADATGGLDSTYNYTYAAAGTSELDFTEGSTLYLNLNITDQERDDYSLKIEMQDSDGNWFDLDGTTYSATYNVNFGSATGSLSATGEVAVVKNNGNIYDHFLLALVVPERVCIGEGACAGLTASQLRVTITDAPDAVAGASGAFTFTVNITDNNPAPTPAACTASPLLTDTAQDIVEGYPFTVTSGCTFTDTSDATDSDGETIVYQWQMSYGAGDCTTSGYTDITNAATEALIFTPEVDGVTLIDGHNICFRLCYGDSGYGNPADCTGGRIEGPWVGGGTDFGVVHESEETLAINNDGSNATWFDSGTNATYIAHANGNQISVEEILWAADGTKVESNVIAAFDSDAGANALEIPYNMSLTGTPSGTYIYLAYQIDEQDNFADPTPIFRVRKINIATDSVDTSYDQYIATADISEIITDGTYWFIAYTDFTSTNNISVAYQTLADATGNFSIAADLVTTSAEEIIATYDSSNGYIVLAEKTLTTNNVNIHTLSTGGAPTFVSSGLDLFSGVTNVSHLAISPNTTGNDNYFVAAQNSGTNSLMVSKIDPADLTNFSSSLDVDNTIAEINGFDALCLVPSSTIDNVLIVTVDSSNAYGTRVTEAAGAFTATSGGTRINSTLNIASGASSNDDISCHYSENITLGDAGDTALENQKDVLNFLYRSAASAYSSLINTELDATTGKSPYFQ